MIEIFVLTYLAAAHGVSLETHAFDLETGTFVRLLADR